MMASVEKSLPELFGCSALSFKSLKIGFIGAGNMARSIVKGLILSGVVTNDQIVVSAPTDRNRPHYTSLNVQFIHDNHEIVKSCHIIIFAVKPYLIKDVLSKLETSGLKEKLFISVAAGVSMLSHLSFGLSNTNFCRLMPTVPIEVGEGLCSYSFSPDTKNVDSFKQLLEGLFGKVAIVTEVTDSQIELSAALGSGVAFMYESIHAMTSGIVKMGLPLHLAEKLVPQVAMGAAKVVKESNCHPSQLVDCVCSPGGTTIHGIHALNKGGFKSTMMDAMEAAVLRAKEMSSVNK